MIRRLSQLNKSLSSTSSLHAYPIPAHNENINLYLIKEELDKYQINDLRNTILLNNNFSKKVRLYNKDYRNKLLYSDYIRDEYIKLYKAKVTQHLAITTQKKHAAWTRFSAAKFANEYTAIKSEYNNFIVDINPSYTIRDEN